MGSKSKNCHPREPVFFISPQVRVTPQESALRYDGRAPRRSFISEDPIGWASGQTNNYAYVGGNPVQYRDPTGSISLGSVGVNAVLGGLGNMGGVFVSNAFGGGCSNYGTAFVNGAVGGAIGSISDDPRIAGAISAGVTETLNEVGLRAALHGDFHDLDPKAVGVATVAGGLTGVGIGMVAKSYLPAAGSALESGATTLGNMLGIPLGTGAGSGASALYNALSGNQASCPK